MGGYAAAHCAASPRFLSIAAPCRNPGPPRLRGLRHLARGPAPARRLSGYGAVRRHGPPARVDQVVESPLQPSAALVRAALDGRADRPAPAQRLAPAPGQPVVAPRRFHGHLPEVLVAGPRDAAPSPLVGARVLGGHGSRPGRERRRIPKCRLLFDYIQKKSPLRRWPARVRLNFRKVIDGTSNMCTSGNSSPVLTNLPYRQLLTHTEVLSVAVLQSSHL